MTHNRTPVDSSVNASPGPSLASVRDLLLPALWAKAGKFPDLEFSISIDYTTDGLIVTGVSKSKNWELGFALSRESILDNLYKEQFVSSLNNLALALSQESIPEGATA